MTEGEKSHSDRPRDQARKIVRTLKNIQLAAVAVNINFCHGVVVCHQIRCNQKSIQEDYTPKV